MGEVSTLALKARLDITQCKLRASVPQYCLHLLKSHSRDWWIQFESAFNFLVAVIKYRVEVYTASESGADTEAELFIQLFGSHGDSGKRVLFNCLNNKTPFQGGQMDLFEVEAVELQEIEKVVMGHEEKGKGYVFKLTSSRLVKAVSSFLCIVVFYF